MNRSAEQQQMNPLREGLSTRAVPQPCSIVIFGATGDLTHRKLIPALYNLAADGELPPAVAIIGFARRPKSDDDFRKEMEEAVRKFSRQAVRDEIWKTFSQSLSYHQSEFGDEAGYKSLAERLEKIDTERGTRGNRLFYFAAGPEQFEIILKNLKAAGLNRAGEGSGARIEPSRQRRLRRKSDVSHRPFSRQRNRSKHLGAAIRERDFRTALEHALHRSSRDHGGGNSRSGSACGLL
jgi:hypothetical protein